MKGFSYAQWNFLNMIQKIELTITKINLGVSPH
jgi:hypothetical protein